MISEIIIIGTEILKGQILDTNSKYLTSLLADLGYVTNYISTVDDDYQRMYDTIAAAFNRSDIIIITGGLGPTSDDITRDVVADFFERKLIFKEHIKKEIEHHFKKFHFGRKKTQMPEINIKQAYIPENSIILENSIGTAPGFIVEKDGKSVIVMPGVPKEMVLMIEDRVGDYLKKKIGKNRSYTETVQVYGKGESYIASKLTAFEKRAAKDSINVGYIANYGTVSVRLCGDNEPLVRKYMRYVRKLFKNIIISGGIRLEEAIGQILKKKNRTIAVAESCSGGLLCKTITDIPGSSAYFLAGFVTYSNKIKEKTLGIERVLLKKYGAVSKQCAEQMALAAKNISRSDFAVSTTGIAGPSGGSKQKPVGTVFISLVDDKNRISTEQFRFTGDRELIRHKTMRQALIKLLKSINN